MKKGCNDRCHGLFPAYLFASLLLSFLLTSLPARAEKKADMVLIEKSKRLLTLLRGGEPLSTYRIALGKNPVGHKVMRGDEKTPVGRYVVDYRNSESRFHRSLRISYPNDRDIMRAMKRGVAPGGNIMIHGLKKEIEWLEEYHRFMDWTEGCIAVTNQEIEEIWDLVPVGTPVVIRP